MAILATPLIKFLVPSIGSKVRYLFLLLKLIGNVSSAIKEVKPFFVK